MAERETLGSRLGFILISASCAVGLGNVWRFPFIAGKYGGGGFVLLYLVFLVIFGFPLLAMELATGRAGRSTLIGSFRKLASGHFPWTIPARIVFFGNLLLMMYYTTVTGWLIAYAHGYFNGALSHRATPESVGAHFNELCSDPGRSTLYMGIGIALAVLAGGSGLRRGVERTVKFMMLALFALISVLAIKALTMPGAADGLKFYLAPDLGRFSDNLSQTVFAAMGQAFFTLSIGVGSMAIFGSYINKKRALAGESIIIIALDTFVALLSGVVIFSICFSFGVDVKAGPGLIFVSLPHIFNTMSGGRWWGAVFFVFLSIAALTTIIAVFENLIAFLIDEVKVPRPAAAGLVGITVFGLSLPCVFGFNLWNSFHPFGGTSTVLDLEDFIVSQNLLPLGALMIVLFCSLSSGWGWKNFIAEANTGSGCRFPTQGEMYCRRILPLLIVLVFIIGYYQMFFMN